jgi:hypothetical protein
MGSPRSHDPSYRSEELTRVDFHIFLSIFFNIFLRVFFLLSYLQGHPNFMSWVKCLIC